MNKRYLLYPVFFLFVMLFAFYGCNREKQFVIQGELKNPKQPYIFLAEMNLTETRVIDSAKIDDDGFFRFRHKTSNPGFFQVMFDQNNFILLLAEPGQRIRIIANGLTLNDNYTVEGSEGSSQVKILTDHLSDTRKTLDSIEYVINSNVGKKGFDTLYKRLNEKYIQTIKDQRNFSIRFIIEHLRSLAGIIALYQQINDSTYVLNQNRDLQFVNLLSDTLKKYYPNSEPVRILCNDRVKLNNAYNMLKLESLKRNAVQRPFPEIALPGANGDTIELSQVKGKAILVNFWSPLNSDCLVVLKSLKELYSVYKKKGFEIYNIALTEKKSDWKSFVSENNLPGKNVIDVNAENASCLRLYNIGSLPASFLIGPEKEIAGKNLFGENLNKKLKEILK
jgi:peroxiredoxin